MWLVVTIVVLVVAIATYLTWVATRVDRLHARAAAAYSALDAHSIRRAAAAAEVGDRYALVDLQTTAKSVLGATDDEERAVAENDLTARLRGTLGGANANLLGDEVESVVEASRRLGLARQLHTDRVRDARAVRRQPVVRLFGFARKYPAPRFFDIDDPTLGDRDLLQK
jgi:hypothetical protein